MTGPNELKPVGDPSMFPVFFWSDFVFYLEHQAWSITTHRVLARVAHSIAKILSGVIAGDRSTIVSSQAPLLVGRTGFTFTG